MKNTDFTEEQREHIRENIYTELINKERRRVFFPPGDEEWEVVVGMLHPLNHPETEILLDDDGISYLWDWFGEMVNDSIEEKDERTANLRLSIINAIQRAQGNETYRDLKQWQNSDYVYGEIVERDDDEDFEEESEE